MVDETDFSALYRELGTSPETPVDAFRHAYRRRVGQLHPDHAGRDADVARLQALNRLYAAAKHFHHVHGRLPGASHVPRGPIAPDPSHAHVTAPPEGGVLRDDAGAGAPAASASFSRYYVVVAIVAIAVMVGRMSDPAPGSGLQDRPGAVPAEPTPGDRGTEWIALGMDAGRVRLIEGPPRDERQERWDYGPSWIVFRCGKVAGWYSSPLRRLRVRPQDATSQGATARPQAEDRC